MISLTREQVSQIDIYGLAQFVLPGHHGEFFAEPGKEHYRLLAAVSLQFEKTYILDLGTYKGNSAVALSHNSTNKVYSYDIHDFTGGNDKIRTRGNIEFKIENYFDSKFRDIDKNKKFILECPLIVIDIDPHEGHLELDLVNWLIANNYKGICLFDDVFLGSMNSNFTSRVVANPKLKCTDLTHLGHYTGTLMISFL
jgi:hypothetical protein